jgi:hypothetical protein
MLTYNLARYAHVLVVVYLLGADLGRFYLARAGAAPAASAGARLLAARATLWLGSVTNAALVLILPAGISLAAALGAYRILDPGWLTATWLVAAAWLALGVAADRAAARPGGGRGLALADAAARLVIGAGHLYDGGIAFAGTSMTVEAGWLAAKISLFGLLILVSIPARQAGFAIRREAVLLAAVADDVGAGERVADGLRRLQRPALVSWLLILLAAWIGVAKPL